jgi:hypothetical protein
LRDTVRKENKSQERYKYYLIHFIESQNALLIYEADGGKIYPNDLIDIDGSNDFVHWEHISNGRCLKKFPNHLKVNTIKDK